MNGGKTNQRVSDNALSQYIPALIENARTAAFDSQCIPSDVTFLGADEYKEFLVARRVCVSQRLTDFIEIS